MPNQPNAIQTLLGIGIDKLEQLRHKESPRNTSPSNKEYIPNIYLKTYWVAEKTKRLRTDIHVL